MPSCGYKKDIRSKNRAMARFFDARKPGIQKCENVDVSKRKIDTNLRKKRRRRYNEGGMKKNGGYKEWEQSTNAS
ncbi:hypothetical protein D5272_05285, partial [bacterium D16-76]|nr:hypothetical protein [bacterium D16-76]